MPQEAAGLLGGAAAQQPDPVGSSSPNCVLQTPRVDDHRVDAALARVRGQGLGVIEQTSSAQALLRSLSAEERATFLQTLVVEHGRQ